MLILYPVSRLFSFLATIPEQSEFVVCPGFLLSVFIDSLCLLSFGNGVCVAVSPFLFCSARRYISIPGEVGARKWSLGEAAFYCTFEVGAEDIGTGREQALCR